MDGPSRRTPSAGPARSAWAASTKAPASSPPVAGPTKWRRASAARVTSAGSTVGTQRPRVSGGAPAAKPVTTHNTDTPVTVSRTQASACPVGTVAGAVTGTGKGRLGGGRPPARAHPRKPTPCGWVTHGPFKNTSTQADKGASCAPPGVPDTVNNTQAHSAGRAGAGDKLTPHRCTGRGARPRSIPPTFAGKSLPREQFTSHTWGGLAGPASAAHRGLLAAVSHLVIADAAERLQFVMGFVGEAT
jgi:hypothetical protein